MVVPAVFTEFSLIIQRQIIGDVISGLMSQEGGSLSRRDYEDLYRADPTKRQAAIAGLVSIGYSEGSATFVLDGVDRGRPK